VLAICSGLVWRAGSTVVGALSQWCGVVWCGVVWCGVEALLLLLAATATSSSGLEDDFSGRRSACLVAVAMSVLAVRPEVRREDPLNLSILLSGGKETNKDSLSNGE